MNHLGVITSEAHNNLARKLNMKHSYIGSAKTGDNVNQMFFRACAEMTGVQVSAGDIAAQ